METYGYCQLSFIPVRNEDSHRSEQVHQLIFGDIYKVLKTTEEWIKIETCYENYTGWISRGQHLGIPEKEALNLSATDSQLFVNTPLLSASYKGNKVSLGIGSTIAVSVLKLFSVEDQQSIKENTTTPIQDTNHIAETAKQFLGTSYLWGGKSTFGTDCSGFVQQVYKIHGIKLPRDAYQQEQLGTAVSLKEGKLGDLAFFSNKAGKVTHVGMLLSNLEIIHASEYMRVDDIDNFGILNRVTKKYTHRLTSVKRIINH